MAKEAYKEDLPIHLACANRAPDSTIIALLDAYTDGASTRGRGGSFPIHVAAQLKLSPVTIVSLIRAFPEALDRANDHDKVPSDYAQKNEICREALNRPAACWIEDVEKEEYLEKVARRRTQLRQKISELQHAIEVSNERRLKATKLIDAMEPRIQAHDETAKQVDELGKKLSDLEAHKSTEFSKIKARIFERMEELQNGPSEEEIKNRCTMKRSYMQGVQKQYEKLMTRTEQLHKDLQAIKVVHSQHVRDLIERGTHEQEEVEQRDDDADSI
eukprot:CAMPEP_0118710906 /NCGR_PEP_ID=MMETSP0800-20121206/23706_1 /TAXON_ID=210618 ORGANISM="Striatella unipunctata, Strain CCMP2910" /NCGR_SAMPLE_ID=MMETSP0800 /ASSEMBLY_ACC=CAM_ASM_000638 /LENGTH=272 /DNA_ID=CAMNT_0006615269 /DNA_START=71 /DNA_END=889 /DNA_ORIENTATION=+